MLEVMMDVGVEQIEAIARDTPGPLPALHARRPSLFAHKTFGI